MAVDRLAAEFFQGAHDVSAPSSADFLFQGDVEEKYAVSSIDFRPERGTLTLGLGDENLAGSLIGGARLEELTWQGFRLARTPHITVMNYGSGSNLLNSLEQYSPAGRQILLRDIQRIAGHQDWSWTPTGEIHPFIGRARGNLKLIALVNCPAVANFYDEIEQLMPGVEIEKHPMHVTLLKKPIDIDAPIERTLAEMGLSRPINSLDHLDIGYGLNSVSAGKRKRDMKAPPHVKETILKRLRIEISDDLVRTERLEVLDGIDHLYLPLPDEVVEKIKDDIRHIDALGAAAVGRRVSLLPEALEHLLPGAGLPILLPEVSPLQRAQTFDNRMRASLDALLSPRIVSQKVITGAVLKIGKMFNNEILLEEMGRRLTIDQQFYPHQPRTVGTYHSIGTALMRELYPKQSPEENLDSNVYPFPSTQPS